MPTTELLAVPGPADILNKLAIVEEEAGESRYWLELLVEADIVKATKPSVLMNEIDDPILDQNPETKELH